MMNDRRILKGISFILLGVLSSNVLAETVKMRDEPIKSRISFKHLNRISVKNDRIASVAGLDAAFHFEKNEKTGDGYIKPTEDNDHEPISISITTASGRIQDLVLEVDDKDPNVLILENDDLEDDSLENDSWNDSSTPTGSGQIGSDFESSVVGAMKRFMAETSLKEASLKETSLKAISPDAKPKRIVSDFKIDFVEMYKIDGFTGTKFKVSSDFEASLELKESDFSEAGDVALALSDLTISKGNPVFLYILSK